MTSDCAAATRNFTLTNRLTFWLFFRFIVETKQRTWFKTHKVIMLYLLTIDAESRHRYYNKNPTTKAQRKIANEKANVNGNGNEITDVDNASNNNYRK